MRRRIFAGIVALLSASLLFSWAPRAWAVPAETPGTSASFNDVVRVIVRSGNTLYVGGGFTQATDSTGIHIRNHVAAVDATTGQLLPWNPSVNDAVWSLAVDRDAVYLGGAFSTVDGVSRRRLAKVSALGGGAVATDFVHRASGTVRAMTVLGGRLYVGGAFSTVGGQSRGRLAAFDLQSADLVSSWTPAADAAVLALASSTDRVYAGGRFTGVDGNGGHGFLAALDPGSGEPVPSFNPPISYPVHGIDATPQAVYAAADGPGGHLRAFELDGDDIFDLPTDGGVQAVAELNGTVYFGGHFDNVCSAPRVGTSGSCRAGLVSRRKLGAASAAGALLPWAPQGNSSLGVTAIDTLLTPDGIAVGGAFTRFRSVTRERFALFG